VCVCTGGSKKDRRKQQKRTARLNAQPIDGVVKVNGGRGERDYDDDVYTSETDEIQFSPPLPLLFGPLGPEIFLFP